MRAQKFERVTACPLPSVLGLNREQAAAMVGISTTLFDKAVEAGTMPQPRMIASRNIWDADELVASFKAIPHKASLETGNSQQSGNAWDNAKNTQ